MRQIIKTFLTSLVSVSLSVALLVTIFSSQRLEDKELGQADLALLTGSEGLALEDIEESEYMEREADEMVIIEMMAYLESDQQAERYLKYVNAFVDIEGLPSEIKRYFLKSEIEFTALGELSLMEWDSFIKEMQTLPLNESTDVAAVSSQYDFLMNYETN